MSLLVRVAAHLRDADIPFALIGASALAAHGISRSTLDQDLLITNAQTLNAAFWEPLADCATVDVRRGDAEDPLDDPCRSVWKSGRADDLR